MQTGGALLLAQTASELDLLEPFKIVQMQLFLQFCLLVSDIVDNSINTLEPLDAIWTLPGHTFVRLHCYIMRSQVSVQVKVPQVCCLWALHSQGVASTHRLPEGKGEPVSIIERLFGVACHLCTRPILHSSLTQCTFLCEPSGAWSGRQLCV